MNSIDKLYKELLGGDYIILHLYYNVEHNQLCMEQRSVGHNLVRVAAAVITEEDQAPRTLSSQNAVATLVDNDYVLVWDGINDRQTLDVILFHLPDDEAKNAKVKYPGKFFNQEEITIN